jgi:diguanylate cyclase (GGDEF)-like protein
MQETDVIRIIEKLGKAGTSFLITLLSVLFTQLIRFFIFLSTDGDIGNLFRGTSFMSSLVSPLVLAPVFSWYFVGAFFKIKDLEKQMRELATYDSMTNLYNRGACLLALENTIRQMKRTKTELTVLYLDIDHFKNINDTYGHDVGDIVIRRFANYLKASLRESDIIGRIGGEEFLVGLPGSDLENGQFVAEKLRQGVENEAVILGNGTTIHIAISIGLSVHHHKEEISTMEILKKADIALYKAKQSGRNRVCVH